MNSEHQNDFWSLAASTLFNNTIFTNEWGRAATYRTLSDTKFS